MPQTEPTDIDMLKKVMVMLASKYLAIKAKMRATETRLIINSLLLRDKKVFRYLFRQRRYFNLPHTVDDGDCQSGFFNNSIATTPVRIEENKMKMEEDYLPDTVEDEDSQSDNIAAALINNSIVNTPLTILQLAEEKMGIEKDEVHPDLRHSLFKDDQMEYQSRSVIDIVKNAKEVQGKEFRLEDDIDQVADLFIQRFHQQIKLQKFQHEHPPSYFPV